MSHATRRVRLAAAQALLALVVVAPATAGASTHASVLDVPAGFEVSEPHLAVAPDDPDTLYAVATGVGTELGLGLLWRSRDAGATWSASNPIGGTGATTRGFDADPVLAAGRDGLLLFGSLALDVDEAAGTAPLHVGTRVSHDHGATFGGYGSADEAILPLCLFFGCPPPPDLEGLDTPWLAVESDRAPFRASAYLAWVHDRADGQLQVRFAASHDGGRSYAPPLVLDQTTAGELDGLEELPHVVVRPDGRVDVTWNAPRGGRVVILHAVSSDGGATFSSPERVVRLGADASRLGVATTLAVSETGRLALCWRHAPLASRPTDGRIACRTTGPDGRWGARHRILPRSSERQYLPTAAFQGERLRVVAYVSGGGSTRLVSVQSTGGRFTAPVTVDEWPVPGTRICAPRPPECSDRQVFIGDYIGLVATPDRVVAAYVAPSPDASTPNRVVVASFD